MPKKKTALTIEERLQQALVPAEEQPYDVPENWVWVRLGALYEVNPKNKADDELDAAFIPMEKISAGMISEYSFEIQEWCKAKKGHTQFADGDVAFAKISPCFENRKSMMLNNLPNSIGGGTTELIILRNVNVNQKYTFWTVLDERFIRGGVQTYSGTVGQQRINMDYVRSYPIPLPPLSEQQRIVECIEELFAKLDEAKERLQEVVDSFAVRKAAILHKAFTGELTKQWRRENGVKDESWEEKNGEEFFEYVTSGSRGWAKYYSDQGSIFVRMGNLNHGTIELDFSDIQYVDLPEQVEGQRSKLQKNDILISITADVGMIGLVREDMDAYINQHVALARPKNDLYAEFLAWYFVSDVGLQQMQNKQRGATKIGLGLQDIRNIILNLPSLPEQHEIVRLIDDLLERERSAQQAAEQALASIDLMKKSILARAFRGELGTNKASEACAAELLKQVLAEN